MNQTPDFSLEIVDDHNVDEIIAFTSAIFPDSVELIEKSYRAAVHPERYEEHRKIRGIDNLFYYIARSSDGKILGTVGLYTEIKDAKDADWLGWFCVAKDSRRTGVGRALLQKMINRATERGKTFLRLYTSHAPDEAAAQILYEKMGFDITGEEDVEWFPHRLVYREKRLR